MDENTQTSEQNLHTENSFDEPSQDVAKLPRRKERGPKKTGSFVKILIVVVVFGLIGGGVWYLLKEPNLGSETSESEVLTQPTSVQQPTATSTPTVFEINRDKITIEIFNGTGIEKEASFLQEKLSDLGYEIIDVGNASDQEYEVAEVIFSKSLDEGVIDEIKDLLEKTYNDLKTNTSSSLDVDVQIFTGLRAGQTLPTPEPTATPTPEVTTTPTPTPTGTITPTLTPTP